MSIENNQTGTLRYILENSLLPERLDTHPWTKSLIVLQATAETPELLKKSPGHRLAIALAQLFTQMMPAIPPRHGKRLDTRWGEFGILAAQYFAPILFGKPAPATLREAWGQIDPSILLFVYKKPEGLLSEADKEPYKLVGNEMDIAPNSTLSDWHNKGLKWLMEMILKQESYLSRSLSKPAVILPDDQKPVSLIKDSKPENSDKWGLIILSLCILSVGLLLFCGFKAWGIYKQATLVRQDIIEIQSLTTASGSKMDRIKAAGPKLTILAKDFGVLKGEISPYLWMGTMLSWVPVYGEDFASAQDLMAMTDTLVSSTNLAYQAGSPLLEGNSSPGLTPDRITEVLAQSEPQLIQAQQKIYEAATARENLKVDGMTPELQDLILNYIDPSIGLLKDGLTVAEELPRLMGVTSEGPKTYLILVENEDELRPTGGLVTAAGRMLVEKGQIRALSFENEDQTVNPLVDWSRPYPSAPWQLQQYMNSPVLLFRDTSWFANYPTAALYAETLYSYVKDASVDGVIAIDQQFLVEILKVTGPLHLEGVSYLVDANNVNDYMRSAKKPTAVDLASPDWNNKQFIKLISDALVEKIYSGAILPERLFTVLVQALNEHHLLLQLDGSAMTTILANRRWDGAVRPEGGDFLMAVDTNIGFNKTNAVVASSMVYDVDLTKLATPIGTLRIDHQNNAAEIICKQWDKIIFPGEDYYQINDCYWNYLRVYMVSGAKLLNATPQFVPANWMIIKQDVPAHVDTLDEGIPGVQAFGTLQVVPGGKSVSTSFSFALPASIIRSRAGRSIYHLLVQKQPGTLAVPITIRVHLPSNASIKTAPAGAEVQGKNVLFQTNLRTDLEFDVVFQFP